jgi:hypothetical protein
LWSRPKFVGEMFWPFLAYQTKLQNELDAAKTAEDAAKQAEALALQAETKAKGAAKADQESLNKAAVARIAASDAREQADKLQGQAETTAAELAPGTASLFADVRDKLAGAQGSLVPDELKVALLALMDNAGTNLTRAQANIEQWFDDAMDRVSGVYKRKSHVFTVIIAVLVTVLANVDTLQVADSLSHDKAVRDSLVAAAPELATKATDGAASQTTTPEPAIGSIKASLNELNKLGLPIGYIRICTPSEEAAVDSCASAAEARVIHTEETLKKAEANVQKAETDRQKAEADWQKAEKDLKSAQANDKNATDENKIATQEALLKAQKDWAKAQEARDKAQKAPDNAPELNKAKEEHEKAVARAAEFKKDKSDLMKAEEEARANPEDEGKQRVLDAARAKAALSTKCPECRKASELSEGQLKQRLPTTHDYKLRSKDFFSALDVLGGDIRDLIYAHWLGWLLTAMAISLGAPFWFDTLNRLMVVRSTVKPHEKSREQESKDNPDEPNEKKKT